MTDNISTMRHWLMSVACTDTSMVLTGTPHRADCVDAASDVWRVSWLPGRVLGSNMATTALVLALFLTDPRSHTTKHRLGCFAAALADELSLTVPEALALLRAAKREG